MRAHIFTGSKSIDHSLIGVEVSSLCRCSYGVQFNLDICIFYMDAHALLFHLTNKQFTVFKEIIASNKPLNTWNLKYIYMF